MSISREQLIRSLNEYDAKKLFLGKLFEPEGVKQFRNFLSELNYSAEEMSATELHKLTKLVLEHQKPNIEPVESILPPHLISILKLLEADKLCTPFNCKRLLSLDVMQAKHFQTLLLILDSLRQENRLTQDVLDSFFSTGYEQFIPGLKLISTVVGQIKQPEKINAFVQTHKHWLQADLDDLGKLQIIVNQLIKRKQLGSQNDDYQNIKEILSKDNPFEYAFVRFTLEDYEKQTFAAKPLTSLLDSKSLRKYNLSEKIIEDALRNKQLKKDHELILNSKSPIQTLAACHYLQQQTSDVESLNRYKNWLAHHSEAYVIAQILVFLKNNDLLGDVFNHQKPLPLLQSLHLLQAHDKVNASKLLTNEVIQELLHADDPAQLAEAYCALSNPLKYNQQSRKLLRDLNPVAEMSRALNYLHVSNLLSLDLKTISNQKKPDVLAAAIVKLKENQLMDHYNLLLKKHSDYVLESSPMATYSLVEVLHLLKQAGILSHNIDKLARLKSSAILDMSKIFHKAKKLDIEITQELFDVVSGESMIPMSALKKVIKIFAESNVPITHNDLLVLIKRTKHWEYITSHHHLSDFTPDSLSYLLTLSDTVSDYDMFAQIVKLNMRYIKEHNRLPETYNVSLLGQLTVQPTNKDEDVTLSEPTTATSQELFEEVLSAEIKAILRKANEAAARLRKNDHRFFSFGMKEKAGAIEHCLKTLDKVTKTKPFTSGDELLDYTNHEMPVSLRQTLNINRLLIKREETTSLTLVTKTNGNTP